MILFETNIESNTIVNWTALLQTCSNTDARVSSVEPNLSRFFHELAITLRPQPTPNIY